MAQIDKKLTIIILVFILIAGSFITYFVYSAKTKSSIMTESRNNIMVSFGQMDNKASADFFNNNKNNYIKTQACITEVNDDKLILSALDVKTNTHIVIKADFGYSLSDNNFKKNDIIMISGRLDNFVSAFSGLNRPGQIEWTLSRCRIEKN